MGEDLIIQFIRNYTAEPIGNAVQELAQQAGIPINAQFGAYDNLGTEIATLSAASKPPSIVVVTIDLDYFCGGIYSPRWNLAEIVDEFKLLLAAIDTIPLQSFVLITNFIPGFRPSMPLVPGHPVLGRDSAAHELNLILREFVSQRTNKCGLLDFDRISARLGESATRDKRFGLMAKSPFKQEFAEAAAMEIMRFLRCRFLPPKKVLVLDCDNTLWGGVIGETGMENIQLDPYEYPGVAYYRFQSEVLAIAEKGFLICLCSKNDEPQVWQAFEHHPHSLIRRDQIAAHRINWTDKASNLKELAMELNLSLDSMVFVDDNPVECELIRSQFPEVTVIQVPAKIYEYPGILAESGLFDRISVNQEDKVRIQYYQAEKSRREVQSRHVDPESFLRDLKMKASIKPVGRDDLTRAAQLCQRTNQFNLTSRRHTEADLALFLESQDTKMFLLEAEDRFGPMGNSGLIIFKKAGSVIEVDTFLLSCRIIGRSFDKALFCQSLKMLAPLWPYDEIRATFTPTLKNSVVSELWREYGFSAVSADGEEKYSCFPNKLKISQPNTIQINESL
jgi:FkbH-like protein